MAALWMLTAVGLVALAGADPETAADLVTLKDGSVVRGQITDLDDRGQLVMIVRRAWAEAELPEKAAAWREAELPWMQKARAERLERLEAWRRDLTASPRADGVALLNWLDSEIDALRRPVDDAELPRLMMTAISRREVQALKRQAPAEARLLRLGWRAGFADVETMPPDDLRAALQGRHLDPEGTDPVALDDLLPTPLESDRRWLVRRAATEVAQDSGLRFVRYGDLVLPEGANMEGAGMEVMGALPDLLGSVLGDRPQADPVAPRLRSVAAKGNVGAVLTSLEISPDLGGVKVTTQLLVEVAREDWRPAAMRSAAIRADQLPPDAGANIEADPQVQSAFRMIEGLGLGGIDPEMKRRSLAIGSATQAALARARELLQADLDALALPVGARR